MGTGGRCGDRGTFSPVVFMPPQLPFHQYHCLPQFPFPPCERRGRRPARRDPGSPQGFQPTLVTPAAPEDVAKVLQEGTCCITRCVTHPWAEAGGSVPPVRAGSHCKGDSGWSGATPAGCWPLAIGHLALAQPRRARGGLVLRLDRKTNEFHYGIAILFHVSESLRLTCSPGCDKPRHRVHAREGFARSPGTELPETPSLLLPAPGEGDTGQGGGLALPPCCPLAEGSCGHPRTRVLWPGEG